MPLARWQTKYRDLQPFCCSRNLRRRSQVEGLPDLPDAPKAKAAKAPKMKRIPSVQGIETDLSKAVRNPPVALLFDPSMPETASTYQDLYTSWTLSLLCHPI